MVLSQTGLAKCIYEQNLKGENLPIGTMLTWSTAQEENTTSFVIEKSEDGTAFAEIGSVKSAGDSDEIREYNFLDVMTNEARAFYRLRQLDADGTFSFSDVILIMPEYQNNFMVARMSAVATKDFFEVTIDAFQDGDLRYFLSNWKGEVVYENEMIVISGLNDISLDLTDQRDGIYKLTLQMDKEEETLVLKKIPDDISSKPNVASKNKGLNGKN
ncbi:MAG: hypothetical protein D6714_15285 [Bacteroidetes bacterium]|nr:MAG: hypothetical protein D6714_15285 [Bacteroidota bacterium]